MLEIRQPRFFFQRAENNTFVPQIIKFQHASGEASMSSLETVFFRANPYQESESAPKCRSWMNENLPCHTFGSLKGDSFNVVYRIYDLQIILICPD